MLKECQDIKILYYTLMYQVMREQYAKEMAGGTTIPRLYQLCSDIFEVDMNTSKATHGKVTCIISLNRA